MNTKPANVQKTVVPMANTLSEEPLRSVAGADLGKRMQDVQELLFGDFQRGFGDRLNQTDERYLELAEETASRFQALTETFERRVQALQEQMIARDREQTAARRRLVNRLGDAIKDMARDA